MSVNQRGRSQQIKINSSVKPGTGMRIRIRAGGGPKGRNSASACNMTAGELLVSVWPHCSAPLNSVLHYDGSVRFRFCKKKKFFIFSSFIPFLFSYFIALAGSPTEVVALTAALCLVVDVNVLTVCTFFFFFGYITWLVGS